MNDQTVILSTPPNGSVNLRCGGIPILDGRMGRLGQNVAVRVDSVRKHGIYEDFL